MDEIMKAADGVSNMALAHEIAVDKNFKLEKMDYPSGSFEKRVCAKFVKTIESLSINHHFR